MTRKILEGVVRHELLLATRQRKKLQNALSNNLETNIKLI